MPTSLDSYAPYDSGPGADVQEAQWRSMMRHMMASGVISGQGNEFEVYSDSSGMQLKVKTGECWIRGHWGESTGEKTVPFAASPTTPTHTRKDRVILRNDFVNNRIELDVLTGTAGVTPTVPALTTDTTKWEIPLAYVDIGNSVTTIGPGAVFDERLLVGEIAANARPAFRVVRTSSTNITSSSTLIFSWQSATEDEYGMWAAGSPTLVTITKPGLWLLVGQARIGGGDADGDRIAEILLNGTTPASDGVAINIGKGRVSADGTGVQCITARRLVEGDVLRFAAWQDSGSTLTTPTDYGGSYLMGVWLGP